MTDGLTWFQFDGAVHEQAFRLTDSNRPMVFVLPDGKTVEPTSVSVDLKFCKDGFKYIIRLEEKK